MAKLPVSHTDPETQQTVSDELDIINQLKQEHQDQEVTDSIESLKDENKKVI